MATGPTSVFVPYVTAPNLGLRTTSRCLGGNRVKSWPLSVRRVRLSCGEVVGPERLELRGIVNAGMADRCVVSP